MNIVPLSEIPIAQDIPTDHLMPVYKTGMEMVSYCQKNNGKGLHAVQVGLPINLFVVTAMPKWLNSNAGDNHGYFVNCSYEPVGTEMVDSIEGCLSLPSEDGGTRRFRVKRHSKVRVRGFRIQDFLKLTLEEFDRILEPKNESIVFQHEIDHSFGTLINQIGKEVFIW